MGLVTVVADFEVVVGGELDAIGHIREGGHRGHIEDRGQVGTTAVVLEGLETLEAFHADVLHLLAGFVKLGSDLGEDAAHDVCAFSVGGVGGGALGVHGEELELLAVS